MDTCKKTHTKLARKHIQIKQTKYVKNKGRKHWEKMQWKYNLTKIILQSEL